MDRMDYFLQIYGMLPRAGPGSNDATAEAYLMCTELPEEPEILDIGCGPGMQTIELAGLSGGFVTAIDVFPLMLDRVTALAKKHGFEEWVKPIQMDMKELTFEKRSFDLIWSEGAIYFLGFKNGLEKIRKFVKPGGYIGVSESVWLKDDPPQEVLDFWSGYPEIDTVDAKLKVIDDLGYKQVGHFVLPPEAWTKEYYEPMMDRIEEMEPRWKDIPDGMSVIEEAKAEIAVFNEYSDYFSYGFFVMRK